MATSRLTKSWAVIDWNNLCEMCPDTADIYNKAHSNPEFAQSWPEFIETSLELYTAVRDWWEALEETEQLRLLNLERDALKTRLSRLDAQRELVR